MSSDMSSVPSSVNSATTEMSMRTASDDEMLTIAQKMHWVTSVVVGTIFVVIGLVGNTLSILIWNRKSLRSSTGIYLIAQAIADIGVLVFFFVTDSIVMMEPSIKMPYSYGVFFSYIGYPFFFLFVICSIWITVGVTVDRYIQVCWIGYSKAMCSQRRAFTGIGIIVLLCFIINLPHFWTFHAVAVEDRAKPDDPGFAKAEFGQTGGSDQYEFWVHCMFLVLVPWVTIFILNMFIIREVSLANKKMNKARGEEMKEKMNKKEAQITRLLLTVTFTFLILIALQCITQCFFMMKPNGANHEMVNKAFSIAKLGVIINSSINFILYCLSGQRFRKELFGLIVKRVDRIKSSSVSMSETSSTRLTSTRNTRSSM
ncbi:hypothetical protein CHS0354_010552 [Potamilus streckersoni]|uniref:G-protein coupled receptors family 1 profile domain-containing protein n=1 Tax=Potamilus streckersoni TaxID=2493646 RepID=A0AAE0VQY9_9BIVA|nr:hypothetical protein CHS0354_010552 [Potamilus streckersoni]